MEHGPFEQRKTKKGSARATFQQNGKNNQRAIRMKAQDAVNRLQGTKKEEGTKKVSK
jgi:hypothetical protein